MSYLKAYIVSDSSDNVQVANMTTEEIKDKKIEALENEVAELKANMESLLEELNKAERKMYRGLGDQRYIDINDDILIAHRLTCVLL